MAASIDYLASDLSFTISYSVARELLDAARENDMGDDALVAVVIAIGIVVHTLPQTFGMLSRRFGMQKVDMDTGASRSAFSFFSRLLSTVERIVLSVVIQLIAGAARAEQPQRLQRVLSLCSTSFFFLFLREQSGIV